MSETTQTYLGLESESSRQTNPGFQSILNYIRERATSEYRKGELFERLMLTYFSEDPDYKDQFSEVYLYKQWVAQRTDFDANDIGIDLVAKEREGGYCAIQCKCYAENTRISKPAIDSFISASASELFTSRLIVDTGGEWGPNALRTIGPMTSFGKNGRSIFDSAGGQCGSLIERNERRSLSTSMFVYPVFQQRRIDMSSTTGRRWSGSSTNTKSGKTEQAVSSTIPIAGSRTLATSLLQ